MKRAEGYGCEGSVVEPEIDLGLQTNDEESGSHLKGLGPDGLKGS